MLNMIVIFKYVFFINKFFAYIFKVYYVGNDFDFVRKDFEKACKLESDNKVVKN